MASSKPGETVGFITLRQIDGEWHKTAAGIFETIGQAVGKVYAYRRRWPTETFAVGKVTLSMIDRPDV